MTRFSLGCLTSMFCENGELTCGAAAAFGFNKVGRADCELMYMIRGAAVHFKQAVYFLEVKRTKRSIDA